MNDKFHPYGYTLSNDPKVAVPEFGVKIRRKLCPLILKLANKINDLPLELVYDGRIKNNKPKIYIATHAFAEDVLNASLAIGEPCYILAGNKEVFLHSFNGFLTWVYGGIVFDRLDNESRKSSIKKMQRVLKLGSSILLFPEGAWNMSSNKLISDLHAGFYNLAMLTGCSVSYVVTYHTKDNKCAAYVSRDINLLNIDMDTIHDITRYIIKNINKCIDLPIIGYKNYNKLTKMLTLACNYILFTFAGCHSKEDYETSFLKIKDAVGLCLKIIEGLSYDSDELMIVNRIKIYLKAIINARKTIVINNIRDEMSTEKYKLMEMYGIIRKRDGNRSLEEMVNDERQQLISKVSYYNVEEEKKSLFYDPIKKDLEDPLVKIKVKKG